MSAGTTIHLRCHDCCWKYECKWTPYERFNKQINTYCILHRNSFGYIEATVLQFKWFALVIINSARQGCSIFCTLHIYTLSSNGMAKVIYAFRMKKLAKDMEGIQKLLSLNYKGESSFDATMGSLSRRPSVVQLTIPLLEKRDESCFDARTNERNNQCQEMK